MSIACFLFFLFTEQVFVTVVNTALDTGKWKDLFAALKNPVLKLPVIITKLAAPLYYEEMRTDKLECGVCKLYCKNTRNQFSYTSLDYKVKG